MQEIVIQWFVDFPDHWAVFFMAMIPITEIRASIPVGITVYDMSIVSAFFWSVMGNIIIGAIVLKIVEPLIWFIIKHFSSLERFWHRYIERLRTKNEAKFNKWGSLALIAFVAIPLPMTGVFSGAIAASIFQVPAIRAIVLLSIGSFVSGILVTSITLITIAVAS